ncbi:hypothetical protein GX586_13570, partial [bacterium]|nr:hypothetical protein [bacterium]
NAKRFDIILPDGYASGERYPVLYMLHGRSDTYKIWRGTDLGASMTGRKFIVVMPEGDNSWYQDAWFYWITRDLVTHVETTWRATRIMAVDGYSMGGFGAFYCGAYAPSLVGNAYRSVGSMSGAFVEPDIPRLLGDLNKNIVSRSVLAQALAPQSFPIYFDCGAQDVYKFLGIEVYNMREVNDDMRNQLLNRGRILWKNLFYYLPDGGHDWAYWNSRIPPHLAHHGEIFSTYPRVAITSCLENVDVPVRSAVITVAGTALVADGISNVTWDAKRSGSVLASGVASGLDGWLVVLTNTTGRNNFTVHAHSNSGTTSSARTTFVLSDTPTVVITSHTQNATTVVSNPVQRVAGYANSASGIAEVSWQNKAGGAKQSGPCTGTESWYADIDTGIGQNVVRITAKSGSGKTNAARATLFRRNYTFRIRKIKVTEKRVFARVSDITHGDVDSLTNAPGGVGFFRLDGFIMPVTNIYWTRKGTYNARYSLKDAELKRRIVVHGKAQKDLCILRANIPGSATTPTNFLDLVRLTNTIPLELTFGANTATTNLMLDAKGAYHSSAPWF